MCSDKPDLFKDKTYRSLDMPHNHNSFTGLQTGTDFNKPIPVKSKQWSNNKINLNKLKVEGPFAQYKTLNTSEVLKSRNVNNNRQTNVVDESGYSDYKTNPITNVSPQNFIKDLLKPKEFPKVEIQEKDRKVDGLDLSLLDHQVLGLEFMVHRETRKPKQRGYSNEIEVSASKEKEDDEEDEALKYRQDPDSFFARGGILADDMGLGKTVQMMALILKNSMKKKSSKTTIIVCPLPLVAQWNQEFIDKAPSVKVLQFHGPKRTDSAEIVFLYDVVITSYGTLVSESQKKESPLYNEKFKFDRVVLDEAHTIKNPTTKAFKACVSLDVKYRWCLTGTPIQNRLDELQSLFKFLGVNKYENGILWNTHIGQHLTDRGTVEGKSTALTILHKLLDKYMLRRTKQVLIDSNVMTVTKTIHREILEFSPFERTIYQKLTSKIIQKLLGDTVTSDPNSGQLKVNSETILDMRCVFVYLLRLRQCCCHWQILFSFDKGKYNDDFLLGEVAKDVTVSSKNVNDEKQEGNPDIDLIDDEINKLLGSMENMSISQDPEKHIEADLDPLHAIKLRRVMNILRKDDRRKPRKTIIFSEFVSVLFILAKCFSDNGIKFVMYHGQMDKDEKSKSLEDLKKDPSIHVLLCSLKSGAYGLNITSCSRVILYEPFWNPAVGAQAIDRAYRIGQKHDVDVHEVFIQDSVEQRIEEIQLEKRKLTNAVVERDAASVMDLLGMKLSKKEILSMLGIDVVDY